MKVNQDCINKNNEKIKIFYKNNEKNKNNVLLFNC